MAELNDGYTFLDPDVIREYVMLTGSDESQARYMLSLYNGNLNFAVDQHLEGHAPKWEDVITCEIEKSDINDAATCNSNAQSSKDQSSHLNASNYLKSCNDDVGSAINMLLQSGDTNAHTKQYLASCSGNIPLAMHNLLETSSQMKRDDSDSDDRFDVYKAARKYLSYFREDLQWAINALVEVHSHETCNGNTTKEQCRYAEQYLDIVGADFEKAFNILLEVHKPDVLSESNEDVFAEEFLAAFNQDSERAVNALLECVYQGRHNDEVMSHAHTCSEIYLDNFEGNYNLALKVLIDASSHDASSHDEKHVDKCSVAGGTQSDINKEYHKYNRMQHNCPCGNDDPTNIKHYFYEDTDTEEVEFIGVYCSKCDHEYLISDVLNSIYGKNENEDSNDVHEEFKLFNCKLYRNTKRKAENDVAGLYSSVNVDDISTLKRGDEFALNRHLYTHHGIVNKVNIQDRQFEGIHYKKVYGQATVVKETIYFDNEEVSKSQYNDFEDHIKLVTARACSFIGDKGYHLFCSNCEHFASFCKTGIRKSSQVIKNLEWLKCKLDKILTENNLKTTADVTYKLFYPKGKANVLKKTRHVQAGIMVIIEGKTIVVEMSRLTSERKNGDITLMEYVEKSFACIISGLIDVTMRIGMSMAGGNLGACIGWLIPPFRDLKSSPTGLFIGSIIGGKVGSLPDHTLGNIIGNYLASAVIPRVLLFDDCAVNDVSDLQAGDHVVFNPGLHHPRCHGIVTSHNNVSHMTLIRSTYGEGVVEEELEFRAPIYRVIYKDGESQDNGETIKRGRSKLGMNEYNLITFNCKHFAQWCKKK